MTKSLRIDLRVPSQEDGTEVVRPAPEVSINKAKEKNELEINLKIARKVSLMVSRVEKLEGAKKEKQHIANVARQKGEKEKKQIIVGETSLKGTKEKKQIIAEDAKQESAEKEKQKFVREEKLKFQNNEDKVKAFDNSDDISTNILSGIFGLFFYLVMVLFSFTLLSLTPFVG